MTPSESDSEANIPDPDLAELKNVASRLVEAADKLRARLTSYKDNLKYQDGEKGREIEAQINAKIKSIATSFAASKNAAASSSSGALQSSKSAKPGVKMSDAKSDNLIDSLSSFGSTSSQPPPQKGGKPQRPRPEAALPQHSRAEAKSQPLQSHRPTTTDSRQSTPSPSIQEATAMAPRDSLSTFNAFPSGLLSQLKLNLGKHWGSSDTALVRKFREDFTASVRAGLLRFRGSLPSEQLVAIGREVCSTSIGTSTFFLFKVARQGRC